MLSQTRRFAREISTGSLSEEKRRILAIGSVYIFAVAVLFLVAIGLHFIP